MLWPDQSLRKLMFKPVPEAGDRARPSGTRQRVEILGSYVGDFKSLTSSFCPLLLHPHPTSSLITRLLYPHIPLSQRAQRQQLPMCGAPRSI